MRSSILFLACASLYANPQKMEVVAGEATASGNGTTLNITASNRAIINWDSFSIGPGELTRFIQPSRHAAVLNRVIGSEMSEIFGSLQANGQIYLVNPHGVVIGAEGRIDTAGFIATTLAIQTEDFIRGLDLHLSGLSEASVINLGTIETHSGPVALLAHRVENRGMIESSEGVSLAAGHELLLSPSGNTQLFIRPDLPSDGVLDEGTIRALEVQIQADGTIPLAIQLGGEKQATVLVEEGGRVYLRTEGGVEVQGHLTAPDGEVNIYGKEIRLDEGIIDVGSGEVLIGQFEKGNLAKGLNSTYVEFGEDFSIHADGKVGGHVLLLSDGEGRFHGSISATGIEAGGNVELSGRRGLFCSTLADVRAENGPWGQVTHDPLTVTIQAGANTPPVGDVYNDAYIADQLSMSNFTITTAPDAGVITFDTSSTINISWSQATRFQLLGAQIVMPPSQLINITNTSSSTSPFTAVDFRANTGNGVPPGSGNFTGIFMNGLQIDTSGGGGAGGIRLEGQGGTTGASCQGIRTGLAPSCGLTTHSGAIDLVGIGGGDSSSTSCQGMLLRIISFTTNTGAITLQGTGSMSSAQDGNKGIVFETFPTITSNGIAGAGAITITGQGGLAGSFSNYGVDFSGSSISSAGAAIVINGYSGGNSFGNEGVVLNGGTITGTGNTTLTVTGVGGTTLANGAGTSSGTTVGYGIEFNGTDVTLASGSVQMTGTGKGTGTNNIGIYYSASTLQTTSGSVTLTGYGSTEGTGAQNMGIYLGSGVDALVTTSGSITLNGTSGTGTGTPPSNGIYINNGLSGSSNGPVRSANGNISMTGTALTTDAAFFVADGNGPYTTGSGSVSISAVNGTLSLEPSVNATRIEALGSGNVTLSSTNGNIVIGNLIAMGPVIRTYGSGNVSIDSALDLTYVIGLIQTAGSGSMTLRAGSNLSITSGLAPISTNTGNLLMLGGQNIVTTGAASITTGGSANITLVADNLFSTPFGIGSGLFNLSNTTTFSSGKVNFYAAAPGTGTFPATINGLPFSSSNQLYGYWYGASVSPPNLTGYQINYKVVPPPTPPPAPVVVVVVVDVTQTSVVPTQVATQTLSTAMTVGSANQDPQNTCSSPSVSVGM